MVSTYNDFEVKLFKKQKTYSNMSLISDQGTNILTFISLVGLFIGILYENVLNIKVDDMITEKIVENVGFLRHINANVLTVSGILMNIYIYKLLGSNNPNTLLVFCCIVYRWLVDCLDGEIARKYNKTSKIGHLLDTISDVKMLCIAAYFIQSKVFNITFYIFLCIYSVFIWIINDKYNIIESHNNLKNTDSIDIVNVSVIFLVNNTYIGYVLLFISIL